VRLPATEINYISSVRSSYLLASFGCESKWDFSDERKLDRESEMGALFFSSDFFELELIEFNT
jgi:hypothetical protein